MTHAEREILEMAAHNAGLRPETLDPFIQEVEKRLRQGAKEYGEHRYLRRSFGECIREAVEEQHDTGGWTSLALLLLKRDVDQGFPSGQADLIRLKALNGVALAVQSAIELEEAAALHAEHAAQIHVITPPVACGDDRLYS